MNRIVIAPAQSQTERFASGYARRCPVSGPSGVPSAMLRDEREHASGRPLAPPMIREITPL